MDKDAAVHKRKKRYMAQILAKFDEEVAPFVPRDVADRFRGTVREKLHAFALDAIEIDSLKPGEEQNGHAVELRDRLGVTPRPTRSTTG